MDQGRWPAREFDLPQRRSAGAHPPVRAGGRFFRAAPDTRMPLDRKDSDVTAAKSIIDLASGGMQAVLETQDEIMARIKGAGRDDDNAAGA